MESNNNSGLFGIVEIKVIWFKRCGNELAYPGIVLILSIQYTQLMLITTVKVCMEICSIHRFEST